jgi:polyhydroxybutyrate depolymerase
MLSRMISGLRPCVLAVLVLTACSADSRGVDSGAAQAQHEAGDLGAGGSSPRDADAAPSADASAATPDASLRDAGLGLDQDSVREVPGFADRAYRLQLPGSATPTSPTPLIIVFHGGGGNAQGAPKITCPNGDESNAGCLSRLAARRGFAVAYANGTGSAVAPNTRTWNAGGGTGDWQCVSGAACMRKVDDVAYFDALLIDLKRALPVDEKRVFLTGISNGAAMAHRLACERASEIAAIAPIAGENQFQTSGMCVPARGVSILNIHGTADPCWGYDGGTGACAQADNKQKLSVDTSIGDWVKRLGCDAAPTKASLPDTAQDGCSAGTERYTGCVDGAEVELVRIEGGGHTWPGGFLYSKTVGPLCTDFDADVLMLDFFEAHPAP